MKLQRENTYTLPTLFLLLMILLNSTSIRAQEVEDEREFDYIEGSEKGPLHWGELKEEWAACKHGDMQSPIDLSSGRVKIIPNSRQLRKTNYKSSNATILNRGHDIAVFWRGNAGSIRINGTEFFLQQCHWHSPSEHSINGRKYDLEMHMVHVRPDRRGNKIVVIGALYKIGHPDPFLSQIRTVSEAQVHLLREAVHDHAEMNARPRQPHNNRDIHLHLNLQFKQRSKP
ncbi:Carbonic anhydrase, alpha-class, conserved site [Sesbania bispinosa]|nr:Carbonic anhydrase, alpha-class, conserved site [Sesbania bispinosa]